MKKTTFFLMLLFANFANATDIIFSDNDFKTLLLSANSSNNIAKNDQDNSVNIDTNFDNQISTDEAALIYELDISGTTNVNSISGIQGFTNLRLLNAENCGLTSINVSNLLFLENLNFKGNAITSVNLDGCVAMIDIDARNNIFATIDLSDLTNLASIDLTNNAALKSINAKNGTFDNLNINGSNGQLTYICCDESQLSSFSNAPSNCVINTLCSIFPGGDFNTIQGTVAFDANSNGIDASDVRHANINLQCLMNGNSIKSISDASGSYNLYTNDVGNFQFQPIVENPSWFSFITPSSTFANDNNNVLSQDFGLAPVGVHTDTEIVITPSSAALSGTNITYEVILKNKGNQTQSGQFIVNFDDASLNFITSTAALSNQIIGQLTSLYSNLLPFETRKFEFTFNSSSSLVAGDELDFNVNINSDGETATTVYDNSFSYIHKIVNTPILNRIECLQGNLLPNSAIGEYLHYQLTFENTGNAVANDVVTESIFDSSKFDLNSIQIVNSSHPVNLSIENNRVRAFFTSIDLGGPGGSGGILLKIKTRDDLPNNSNVESSADVFFNYNVNPITVSTNIGNTTFQNLSNSINKFDNTITVFPNPSSSIINIESDNEIKSIYLYDVFGRLLQTNNFEFNTISIDISKREQGIYFMKIVSAKGEKVEKIIKK